MSTQPQDLTVAEVAVALHCSRKKVRALAIAGDLRGYRLGRGWRFEPTEVTAFRRRNTVRPELPVAPAPRVKARNGGALPGWHDFDHGGRPS